MANYGGVMPRYRAVVDDLKNKITSGQLAPGDQIPSTSALCAEYEVSATVVHQAILILATSGLIVGVPGVGRFVKEPS